MLGIRAKAEVQTSVGEAWLCNWISSGGLWGIESDADESYLKEVEQEQFAELADVLRELGFSDPEINNAQK